MNHKTYSQKAEQVKRNWVLIDASEAPLGRLAVVIAGYLIGKHKPTYTPHIDGGDYVVVINAAKTVVTGDKEKQKQYHRYSGYPGGLTSLSLTQVRFKHPERLIINAVKGMLPKNKLTADRLKRLKVFADENHAHQAQTPTKVSINQKEGK